MSAFSRHPASDSSGQEVEKKEFDMQSKLIAFVMLLLPIICFATGCRSGDSDQAAEKHEQEDSKGPDVSCQFHLRDIFNKGIEQVLRNDKLDVVILAAPSKYRVDDYFTGVLLFVNNKHFYGVSSKGVVVGKFLDEFKVGKEYGWSRVRKSVVDRAQLEAYKKLDEENPGLIGKHLREVTNKMGRPIYSAGYNSLNDGRLPFVDYARPMDVTKSPHEFKEEEITDPEVLQYIKKQEAWVYSYNSMRDAAIAKFVFEGGLAIYTDSNGTILIADQEIYYEGIGWR